MHVYLLLDRSGSMSSRWGEAVGSVNAYVSDLAEAKDTREAKVTLATFDEHVGMRFDVIRSKVAATEWRPVTEAEAEPRGSTPLFDAIGRIVGLAGEDRADKAIIVVMTDGYENASREITQTGAKAALDRCRSKGWQVVFLGADFDAMSQAAAVGTMAGQTLNTTAGSYRAATEVLAERSIAFAAEAAPVSFSPSDRARAARPR